MDDERVVMTTDGVGLNETGDGSGGMPDGADAVDLQSTSSVDKEEQLSQTQPYDSLDDRGVEDRLDEGIVPPQKWSPGQGFGNTAAEQREGETLDQRIAQEEPRPLRRLSPAVQRFVELLRQPDEALRELPAAAPALKRAASR